MRNKEADSIRTGFPHAERISFDKYPDKYLRRENAIRRIPTREELKERPEDIRHTPVYRELYRLRKEKIERVFADAKEKYSTACIATRTAFLSFFKKVRSG